MLRLDVGELNLRTRNGILATGSEATILWDQIGGAVDSVETGYRADAIDALLAFARDAEPRWRL